MVNKIYAKEVYKRMFTKDGELRYRPKGMSDEELEKIKADVKKEMRKRKARKPQLMDVQMKNDIQRREKRARKR